jgi:predicted RNase H-like HicB family nuclease
MDDLGPKRLENLNDMKTKLDEEVAPLQTKKQDLKQKEAEVQKKITELQKKPTPSYELRQQRDLEIQRIKEKELKPISDKIKEVDARIQEIDQYKSLIDAQSQKTQTDVQRGKDVLDPQSGLKVPCFPPTTPVWTPDGLVTIDKIAKGDSVYAYDTDRKEMLEARVTAVIHSRTAKLYHITTPCGKVETTANHPFWVENQRAWVQARNLEPSMQFFLQNGESTSIDTIETQDIEMPTYNLSIDVRQNYFVGPGILVHNMADPAMEGLTADTFRTILGLGDKPVNMGNGPYKVYVGINPAFPDKIYVGITIQEVEERNKQHIEGAKEDLKLHNDPNHPSNLDSAKLEQRMFKTEGEGIKLFTVAEGIPTPENLSVPRKTDRGRSGSLCDGSCTPPQLSKEKAFIAEVIEEQYAKHLQEMLGNKFKVMNDSGARMSATEVEYRTEQLKKANIC